MLSWLAYGLNHKFEVIIIALWPSFIYSLFPSLNFFFHKDVLHSSKISFLTLILLKNLYADKNVIRKPSL